MTPAKKLTVGSLFAGIGGLELGLERTGGFETKWQVEIDDYARRVLEKHWPHARQWDDVRTFPPEGDWSCDVICGGVPCQPVSLAGKQQGDIDERWLWPEFFRVVRAIKPRWVLGENVPGLLSADDGRLFGDILRELAESGYDAQWQSIPAGAFGAHFRGDRVYVVAATAKTGCLRRKGQWKNPARAYAGDEFTRLVERELSLCVPAGKGHRVSDGVPHRVDRLRCLGNAVVPQAAQFVGEMILDMERSLT